MSFGQHRRNDLVAPLENGVGGPLYKRGVGVDSPRRLVRTCAWACAAGSRLHARETTRTPQRHQATSHDEIMDMGDGNWEIETARARGNFVLYK